MVSVSAIVFIAAAGGSALALFLSAGNSVAVTEQENEVLALPKHLIEHDVH